MEYAIVHRISGNVVEKHSAQNVDECREKYLAAHPELGCDTVSEMMERYPVLTGSLWMIPLN